MDLNIGFNSGESFVSNNLPLLKPWTINEVQFDGIEYTSFNGKKDPSATYEVLKFKFKGEKGQYVETIFAPKPGDEKRGERENANGHKIPTPSNLDNFKAEIGQLLTFICPEALEKMSGKSLSFQKLAEFLVKATEKSKGTTVYIKLIGNKSNKPRFPYFLSFFEGRTEPAITDNFISNNINALAFTDFQMSQKEKIENAKPTDMASVGDVSTSDIQGYDDISGDGSDGLDIDLLA